MEYACRRKSGHIVHKHLLVQSLQPRVFLSSTVLYSFVSDDVRTLQRHFELDLYIGSGVRGAWENFRRARRADVTFCWFGSVYTFFAVMGARSAGRRSIVMLGGVDVAREPTIEYGLWRSRWKGTLLGWALRNADRIYAVDPGMRATLERSSGKRWPQMKSLPTGYDPDAWTPEGEKEDHILCVAACNSLQRVTIKGIDLLLGAARLLPDRRFVIIGIAPEIAASLSSPPNVTLLPPLPRERLLEHYRRARVYCQPSRFEGLPNTLCEAMLCCCTAVGSDVGGIPTAIGTSGFIVEREKIAALADGIEKGFAAPATLAEEGRERIVRHFSRQQREQKLVETIMTLADA